MLTSTSDFPAALSGISGILVTPFDRDDQVAPALQRPVVDRAIRAGQAGAFRTVHPASNTPLDPAFSEAGPVEVGRACALAWAAFDTCRETSLEARAGLLEAIAAGILAIGDAPIERATAETALPRARIEGERGRTVGQLRLLAAAVRTGGWLGARIDPAQPDRTPLPRADLPQRHIALGPVAVFGASNFPLAFSVAGGDTASALAAGCPVVVKAQPAHPGTSELVGRAVQAAVAACGLPEGAFSLLSGSGTASWAALVADPSIKAVGFTGSRQGGLALLRIAQARPEPIPVYAEMSSVNPVFLLPGALESRGGEIGRGFAASLTLGAGQFCTNPGLVFAVDGPGIDAFLAAAQAVLATSPAATMLTPGMHAAYEDGVARLTANPRLHELVRGRAATPGSLAGQPVLFGTDADGFRSSPAVQDEVFGAASVLVRCPDVAAMRDLVEGMEGQLTVTLHLDGPGDIEAAGTGVPGRPHPGQWLADRVEVGHAMMHGGPYPATSDSRSTSVGSLAIQQFLCPVCYQDLPAALLPAALQDGTSLGIPRLVDGAPAAAAPPASRAA